MKINEANIDIVRENGKLLSVSVEMPIWDRILEDNFISVNIPLFNIKTFAKDEEDISVAIEEAIKAFCINVEKFGNGLESELKLLGWSYAKTEKDNVTMSYCVPNHNSVFDQIMKTGEQFAQKLELAY